MFFNETIAVFLSTFLIIAVIWNLWKKLVCHPANLPPCLPTVPFLGTLPFLPDIERLPEFFREKAKIYGNVFSLYMVRRLVIVINGRESINEAFVKRGVDYASRPKQYLDNIFNFETRGILGHRYDSHFKKYHAISLNILKKLGFGKNHSIERRIQLEVEDLLEHINRHESGPFDPRELLTSSVSNVIASIIFGKRRDLDDPFLCHILEIIHDSVRDTKLPLVINFFPILRFLPKYKRGLKKLTEDVIKSAIFFTDRIRECMQEEEEKEEYDDDIDVESSDTIPDIESVRITKSELRIEDFSSVFEVLATNRPISRIESDGKSSSATKSDRPRKVTNFVTSFYEQTAEGRNCCDDDEYEQLFVTIRDLFLAGSETTATTLQWLLVTMANHPEVQTRLQNEIDTYIESNTGVNGKDGSLLSRLPSLEDRPYLPSLEAAILEIMRYRTLVPLSLPHSTIKDTTVAGFFVPANTFIIQNLYSAHMEFDNPEAFDIDRFLDSTKQTVINKDKVVAFSMGKRSCLGEMLARQELFLYASALLQRYRILPAEGQLTVKVESRISVVQSPSPFEVRFVRR